MSKRKENQRKAKKTSSKSKLSIIKRNHRIDKKISNKKNRSKQENEVQKSTLINIQNQIEDQQNMECMIHEGHNIEFICTNLRCLKKLCSFCIMDHKYHITDIEILANVIVQNLDYLKDFNVCDQQLSILESQKISLHQLEDIYNFINENILERINDIKNNLIHKDEQNIQELEEVNDFQTLLKNSYPKLRNVIIQKSENIPISKNLIDFITLFLPKKQMADQQSQNNQTLVIEKDIIVQQLKDILRNNIQLFEHKKNLNSTSEGVPKVLHWFDWDKRDLHLYDIVQNCHQCVKLTIPFKIPAFSRSLIIPDGRIFLMGGEGQGEPNEGAKNSVYCYDVTKKNERKVLKQKQNMPSKKIDFTLTFIDDYIYVICGKDSTNEIVDSCEAYNVSKNEWKIIASVHRRRYAATAVAMHVSKKIYLFGGRGDHNNTMIKEIEEYSIFQNTWKIIKLKEPNEWVPVEVCSSVQISAQEILIFGGSDINVEDQKNCYIFKTDEYQITRTKDLSKPHVFVNNPFIYGNYVMNIM